jgi:hypothetical protein
VSAERIDCPICGHDHLENGHPMQAAIDAYRAEIANAPPAWPYLLMVIAAEELDAHGLGDHMKGGPCRAGWALRELRVLLEPVLEVRP